MIDALSASDATAHDRAGDEARVTVVVATRDRRGELLVALERLRAATPASPVVVVDNGSTDGSPAAVRQTFPEIHVVEAGRNLGGAGRTLGVRLAGTPYVAFNDDDSWWAPGSLARAVATLDAHPRLGLVAARVLVGPEERLDPISAVMAHSPLEDEPDLPGRPVLGFLACSAVVRRTAYLAVGGFDPLFVVGGEEQVFALDLARRGWSLVYLDDAVVHHHPSTRRDGAERQRRQVRNDLLSTWLRRPFRSAARRTAVAVRAALSGDPVARGALRDALAALPKVARKRTPIDGELESRVRRLES